MQIHVHIPLSHNALQHVDRQLIAKHWEMYTLKLIVYKYYMAHQLHISSPDSATPSLADGAGQLHSSLPTLWAALTPLSIIPAHTTAGQNPIPYSHIAL